MTTTKTTVMMGDCPCGTTTPHKKFYRNDMALHTNGFFSVEEGREVLNALVDASAIDEAERDRLTHRLLGESGLPTTKEEAVINDFSSSYGFASPAALEKLIENLISHHAVSAAGAETVRNRIAAMTDEQKIDAAVAQLQGQNLDDPNVQGRIAECVDPVLADRVKEAARKYQAEHPPLPVNSDEALIVDTGDDWP